ncbi:MAG TPA: polyhydroxyalkanoate synthesis regulator DNA-binding domain-containing protein [Myxococcales bacterium]|jgi:polyhydroxyalkanoate synthesis repressor PhaR
MVQVKKYGNRRLYDTVRSRYITLEELAAIVRGGENVQVVDAKTGEDLTAGTLTQILVEGRGAARLLPLPLLVQLIRMGDDALAEFFGQYVTWALQVYIQAREGAQSLNPFGGLFGAPFQGGFPRPFGGAPPPPQRSEPASDVQELRKELDELKKSLKRRR